MLDTLLARFSTNTYHFQTIFSGLATAPTAESIIAEIAQLDIDVKMLLMPRITFNHVAFDQNGVLVSAVHIPANEVIGLIIGVICKDETVNTAAPRKNSKVRSLYWPLPVDMPDDADANAAPYRWMDSVEVGLQPMHFAKRRNDPARINARMFVRTTPNYREDPIRGQMLVARSTRDIPPDELIVFDYGVDGEANRTIPMPISCFYLI